MLRVAHITDLHLSVSEPNPHGLSQWERLDRVFNAVEAAKIELVICGGDIALERGDRETYLRFARLLEARSFDMILQPGNHDDPTLFPDTLGRRYRTADAPLDRAVTWKGLTFLIIDSSRGIVTDEQLRWVSAAAATMPSVAALFTHYPVYTGMNRIMDTRYALREPHRVQALLEGMEGSISLFCGHYHMEHLHREGDVSQWITPAVYVQIDPEAETFTVAHTRPAYRVIDFSPEGSLLGTEVTYLDH